MGQFETQQLTEQSVAFGQMFFAFIFAHPEMIAKSHKNLSYREISQYKKEFKKFVGDYVNTLSTETFVHMLDSAKIMTPKRAYTKKSDKEKAAATVNTTGHRGKKHIKAGLVKGEDGKLHHVTIIPNSSMVPVEEGVVNRAANNHPKKKNGSAHRPEADFPNLQVFQSYDEIPSDVIRKNVFKARVTLPYKNEIDKSFPILLIYLDPALGIKHRKDTFAYVRHAYNQWVKANHKDLDICAAEHLHNTGKVYGVHISIKAAFKRSEQ